MTVGQFFDELRALLANTPRSSFPLLATATLITGTGDFLFRAEPDELTTAQMICAAVGLLFYLDAAAEIALSMAGERPLWGRAKFVVSSFAITVPFSLGLLLLIAADIQQNQWLILPIFGLLAVGCLSLGYLPALPIAQALSNSLVSPIRVLRATKAHRLPLFVVLGITGTITGLVPDFSRETSDLEFAIVTLIDCAVTLVLIILQAGVSVVAWRLATANDPLLKGDPTNAPTT